MVFLRKIAGKVGIQESFWLGVLSTALILCSLANGALAAAVSIPDSTIRLRAVLHVGTPVYRESKSPVTDVSVVFEDDGAVAYLYALENGPRGAVILDMLHIYDVGNVRDEHRLSDLKLAWSADGRKALLLINDSPHAAFDFAAKRGYCRNNYPPPNSGWTAFGHEWDDEVLKFFQ